jgi:hypothetical protein
VGGRSGAAPCGEDVGEGSGAGGEEWGPARRVCAGEVGADTHVGWGGCTWEKGAARGPAQGRKKNGPDPR